MKKIIYFLLNIFVAYFAINLLRTGISNFVSYNAYLLIDHEVPTYLITGSISIILFLILGVLITVNFILYGISKDNDKPVKANKVLTIISGFVLSFYLFFMIVEGVAATVIYGTALGEVNKGDSAYFAYVNNFNNSIIGVVFNIISFAFILTLTILFIVKSKKIKIAK